MTDALTVAVKKPVAGVRVVSVLEIRAAKDLKSRAQQGFCIGNYR